MSIRVKLIKKIDENTVLLGSLKNSSYQECPKDYFDNHFKHIEDNVYEASSDLQKKFEDVDKDLSKAVAMLLMSKAKDPGLALTNMGALSAISEDFCKKYECDMQTFLKLLKEKYDNFVKGSINIGAGFDPEIHTIPEEVKKKNRKNWNNKNKARHKKMEDVFYEKETMSIGDMIKAKQEGKNKK